MPFPWAALAPFGAALVGGLSAKMSNSANAREARRNREFQERMSSSAHQREVRDLRAAGINPMLSRMGSGATTPGGDRAEVEDVGSKALGAAMAAAQLQLVKAQTRREDASARLAGTQASDISSTLPGRTELMSMQADVARMSAAQLRELLPSVLAKAQEEIALVSSSARAAKARAFLDEASAAGAANLEAFEKTIGEAGPWVKLFYNMLKGLKR